MVSAPGTLARARRLSRPRGSTPLVALVDMLDPKLLRQDLDAVVANLARRGFAFDRERYLALEKMAERYAAHAGERIFAPDPEGEGQDILDWLARVPRVGPRPHEPRHEPG